jgi:hypothetical protein
MVTLFMVLAHKVPVKEAKSFWISSVQRRTSLSRRNERLAS